MSFRPCAVVPVFEHGGTVGAVVAALRAEGLPVFLTDDGSSEATRRTLEALAASDPALRLRRFDGNRGKGAAVVDALLRAHGEGFTHALQVDADGQHDLADLPRFLALARSEPEAVVAGRARYGPDAPRARVWGRWATHLWVWVHTLSTDIGDSLCGYRLYPLAATAALLARETVPPRMDFDTEMIVRLAWAGVPVRNLDTAVRYPEGGLSHFRAGADTWRIARMHTRLFFGMLRRAPRLLARRLRAPERHWSRTAERGAVLGLRITAATYRLLGRRAASLLLVPVTAYFFLTGGRARRASLGYLRRLRAQAGPLPGVADRPGWRDAFRHTLAYADACLDRLAAWAGRLDAREPRFDGREAFEALRASGRGAVLLGAHLGNLDVARAFGQALALSGLNAVVHTAHAQRLTELLRKANPAFDLGLVEVARLDPETAIRLKAKVEAGELLVIVGDRTPPAEAGRVCHVPFLGEVAPFPQGPFLLAALLECPVYLFFCVKEAGRYRLVFEPFSDEVKLPRKARVEALEGLAARYAARLEGLCAQYPLQWFNFFDFWHPASPSAAHDPHASLSR